MPGEPAVYCGFFLLPASKGQKQRKHSPQPLAMWFPACPHPTSPWPSQLVTKEKHVATLMQLGKCYFSSAARSRG